MAKGSAPKRKSNEDNDPYWEISNKRRVTIQKFKGKTLIAIREYYEKDGKQLPGKSGISLTPEQFMSFLWAIDDIKKALKTDYNETLDDDDDDDDVVSQDDEDKDDDDDIKPPKRETKKRRMSESPES